MDTVRLMVRQRQGNHTDYLCTDGTWKTAEDGTSIEGAGIPLPRAAVEAIRKAISEWQGKAADAATESAVLREWLAVERGRVDLVLSERNR